ncbi:MAG: hypothetical protein EZS28_003607 [Streblomastix strix]|uniref:Uncharacterized protein n=1 Tax=Streblomastix strix TaxID=222440 RepID=A0A5J4X1H1_9EUKA|nr:MAG: hypothetical protein EZS28_003607 [Streblomastix strix]
MLVQIILILGLYFSREQLKRLQNVKYDEICSIHGPIIISDKWSCEIPAFSVVEISPGDTGEAQDRFSVSFFSLKDEYENGTEHVFSAVGPGAQEEKFELFNFRSMKINCINCSLPTYNSKIIFYQRSFYNWPISLLIGLLISIPFIVCGILITPLLLIAVLYTHVQGNLFAFRSGHDLISKISEQILIVSESINDDNIDEQQSGFIELFASELDTTFIVIASLIIDNPGMEKDSDTIRFLKNQKRNEENKRIEKDKQLSQIINRGLWVY